MFTFAPVEKEVADTPVVVKSVVETLTKKARAAIGHNHKAQLATVELRRLVEAQRSAEKHSSDVSELLASYSLREAEYVTAYRATLENGSVDQIREAFEKMISAKAFAEVARVELASRSRQISIGIPLQIFLSKNKDAKSVLLAVAQGRLSVAKASAESITKDETKRLGSGFDADDVAASPVVRRATSKVRDLELKARRIESEPIEITFPIFSQTLLEG